MADEPKQEDSDEQESALVPKSLFGGDCKVGDTYTVKVVGIYDDELEVEHVGDKGSDSDKKADYGMKDAEAEMDNMAVPE